MYARCTRFKQQMWVQSEKPHFLVRWMFQCLDWGGDTDVHLCQNSWNCILFRRVKFTVDTWKTPLSKAVSSPLSPSPGPPVFLLFCTHRQIKCYCVTSFLHELIKSPTHTVPPFFCSPKDRSGRWTQISVCLSSCACICVDASLHSTLCPHFRCFQSAAITKSAPVNNLACSNISFFTFVSTLWRTDS